MKKKWLIISGVLVGVIALIVLLSFTAFSLKTIEIDYRTSVQYIKATREEIASGSKIKKGKPVYSYNRKKYINNIENVDPYIKVINIEAKFPSKFIIHINEREEVYAIKFNEAYYICDDNLRVLRITEDYKIDNSSPMLLNLEIELEHEYKEGEYIRLEHKPNIYGYLFENNRTLGEQKSLIESITLTNEIDKNLDKAQNVTLLKLFSGQTVKIVNDNYGMKYKVKLMLKVFSQLYDFIGKEINVEGEKVTLTEENLKSCTILINNYYDYTHFSEKDCYFNILLN